jgi:hypothetical protein
VFLYRFVPDDDIIDEKKKFKTRLFGGPGLALLRKMVELTYQAN